MCYCAKHFTTRIQQSVCTLFIWRCIEVVITGRTRNALALRGTRVRIPPSPFHKSAGGIFHRHFLYTPAHVSGIIFTPANPVSVLHKSGQSFSFNSSRIPFLILVRDCIVIISLGLSMYISTQVFRPVWMTSKNSIV